MPISQRAHSGTAASAGFGPTNLFLAQRMQPTGLANAAVHATLRSAMPKRDALRAARAERYAGFAVAVALHVALIVALLQYEPARNAIEMVAPIMVSMIAPPKLELPPSPPEQPKPVVQPPRAQPVQKPVEQPPIIARPPDVEPTPIPPPPEPLPAPAIEPVKPEPPPPVEPVAQAEPVAAVQPVARAEPAPHVEAAVRPPPPVPPEPITPPQFNADYLHNPTPTYPSLSRRMGEQGKVLVRVLVSAEGLVERIELKNSSGSRRLDQAALDAVKQWKFVPARQGDLKVSAWVLVPIVFALQG
jgi:periplasmic protein TonB